MFLTRPHAVVVFSSDRYKIFFSNMKAPSAAFWYCSLVQVSVLFLFILSFSAIIYQSSMVPASGCKIQTNSGPYKPILNSYNWNVSMSVPKSLLNLSQMQKVMKMTRQPKYSWARDDIILFLITSSLKQFSLELILYFVSTVLKSPRG